MKRNPARVPGSGPFPARAERLGRNQRGSHEVTILLGLVAAGLIALPLAFASFDGGGGGGSGSGSGGSGGGSGNPFAGQPETNEGALEGAGGREGDPGANNALPPSRQTSRMIPTNGLPSPLFGAQPYTQRMLMFEEFGREPIPTVVNQTLLGHCPEPNDARSCPGSEAIDAFLAQGLEYLPTRLANETGENPWRARIEAFLGRSLVSPPCEGRPAGEGFAHQRWPEFTPQMFFQSATTGARGNRGLRDQKQMHGFTLGEFGPGGLYHVNPYGVAGSNSGIPIKIHPSMPTQDPLSVWTFDGTLPPKLLMARYGEPILFRHYNLLPIDPAANRGFGLHTITTHEHNGHNPAESDGFANAFFFPGQYYDYRWPMIHAGYDTINTTASDRRCGMPDGHGGIVNLRGDWRETMSTHWFHDHMLDFTAQNVYKGSAAMMNYYSSLDRGNEAIDDGVNLRFPSGTALDWGNRDYDVNLVVADKAWTRDGQLWFNIFNKDGFLGDQLLVNWQYKPFLDVRARKYRFRILNGAVSRYLKLALVDSHGNAVPFWGIANDGNVMEHSVAFDGTLGTTAGVLPEQGIAERWDIVVDFSRFAPGERLYFVNLLEHQDGKKPSRVVPLRDVISGSYRAVTRDDNGDGLADRWDGGDPCVGKFLELRVQRYTGTDRSMNPANFIAGRGTMVPLNRPTTAQLAQARHRTFTFGRSGGTDAKPWTVATDGGDGFNADMRRISAARVLDEGVEVWTIQNGGNGWSHPVHVHFEESIYLSRNGGTPPEWERWARKDMYRIGNVADSSSTVEIAIRVREFAGTYMEHCHNTQHEDNAMLLRWDALHPGQLEYLPCPIPTWDGVEYTGVLALPTARTGDGRGSAN